MAAGDRRRDPDSAQSSAGQADPGPPADGCSHLRHFARSSFPLWLKDCCEIRRQFDDLTLDPPLAEYGSGPTGPNGGVRCRYRRVWGRAIGSKVLLADVSASGYLARIIHEAEK